MCMCSLSSQSHSEITYSGAVDVIWWSPIHSGRPHSIHRETFSQAQPTATGTPRDRGLNCISGHVTCVGPFNGLRNRIG